MVLMSTQEIEGQRLCAELQVVCGHLNVLHAELVSITRQALATNAWHGDGVRSIEHWLAWRAGISTALAAKITAVARRVEELPETTQLFTDGLLSLDQIAAVARYTPAHHDHTAAGMVRNLTVKQIGIALGKKFFPGPPPSSPLPSPPPPLPSPSPNDESAQPAPDPEPPAERHSASAGFDDAGEFFLRANADAATGALILRALQEAKDALFRAGNKDVTWLDALSEIARRSLDTVPAWTRRDRYKVIIHVDAEGAWVHQGPRVPNHIFEQWTCDGTVQPLWHLDGRPINLGRRQHTIPVPTRIVVENRDRICQHPTCTSVVGLAVHHIRHWTKHRGPTDTCNLICLCAFHHSQLHNGTFTIEGNADQPSTIVFRNLNGDPITGRANPTPPDGTPPPDPVSPYRHPFGYRLETRWLHYAPAPSPAPSTTPSSTTPSTTASSTASSRPPTDPEPGEAASDPAVTHDHATDTTPGQPDQAPNPAAGPHAPPSGAADAAA